MVRGGGFSRRRFLRSSVALASAWELQRAAWALGFEKQAPVCALTQEQEVGPYYVAQELLRANIREDKPGVPLTLRLAVMDARTCKPLEGAAVDVWHCDALGVYAGFTKVVPMGMGPGGPGGPPPGFGPNHPGGPVGPRPGFDPQHPGARPGPPEGMGAPPEMKTTDALTFLRGIQFTDSKGQVAFETVFPGFYPGRTNHIHFKVRERGHVASRERGTGKTYVAGHTSHVGQVFFPEELAMELMRQEPYSKHRIHRTTQAEDTVFNGQHGETSISRLQRRDAGTPGAGYVAELVVAVDPTKTPASVGPGGPGGPGGFGGPPPGSRPPQS